MRLINIIRKIVGTAVVIEPIGDKESNANIPEGYAGGSLADENILIISNTVIPKDVVDGVFTKEKAYYSVINTNRLLCLEDITNASKDLIGPFTHIINVFYDKKEMSLISQEGQYNDNDSMYQFYQWQQEEVDYLVKLNQYATICSIYISGTSIDNLVKKKNVEMCIRGLAESMSNHRIICNGIVSDDNVAISDLLQSSVFLSSRYGQIMTGEVLKFD